MTTQLTLDELKEFLARAVGEDETVALDGDILDTNLMDLGFDSLAIIDTTSRLERHFKIKVPESAAADIETPRHLIDLVNQQVALAGTTA
ncbi:acyl carrier protein [Crossiella sp. SN42]|uniref:acyl carrier protein n=1 Tax=Crossiella sp. SN42 TaxID=2944808 RepID=UPI00207C4D5D|nr:acyl carrier protein [Crossiella sp. SN42]MCO1576045.1 acyl carrier protein [Crossiella sp. SN42]